VATMSNMRSMGIPFPTLHGPGQTTKNKWYLKEGGCLTGCYDWQELVTSDMVSFFRRFPLATTFRRAYQYEHVVVLVNYVGVWLYPPPEKANTFIAKQGFELLELKGGTVRIEALTPFVTPTSAAKIVAMYGQCKSAQCERQAAWRFYRLASSELVMAKNLCFIDTLHHLARPTAVLVRRHGVSIQQKKLQDGTPSEKDSALFIPAKVLCAEILRRYFSAVEVAEIMAVYKMNRDELLHCLPGGPTAKKD
jgi:hypothetical protein